MCHFVSILYSIYYLMQQWNKHINLKLERNMSHLLLAKAKVYKNYIVPQATTAAALFCVTDRAGVQPTGCRLSPHPQALTCNQTAICSPGLPFNGLHPHNPCELLLIYKPQRDGRLSRPSWLTHSWHNTHKVVTCQPWTRHRSGKVRQAKTRVLTTEPCSQPRQQH